MPDIDLHKLTIVEIGRLRSDIEDYLAKWYGFSHDSRCLRTPEWIEKAKWRLEGQTEPCCECGEDYPTFDLHFDHEIYCEKCRKVADEENKALLEPTEYCCECGKEYPAVDLKVGCEFYCPKCRAATEGRT